MEMREYAIAAIPADGIGQELIAAGTIVLASLEKRLGDIKFNIENFDWGSDYYKKHGVMMPSDGLEQLRKFDAIYFGAVGAQLRRCSIISAKQMPPHGTCVLSSKLPERVSSPLILAESQRQKR
jgi:isocitrate/isopropylmalate dehydrogenase